MPTPLSQLLIDFLDYLQIEKNRSPLTRRNYEFYLGRFLAWGKISRADEITSDLVRKFRLYLHNYKDRLGNGMKVSTQNYHLIALRSFLKYLAKRDVQALAPEKIELAKIPERQVQFLAGNELERLLEAPLRTTDHRLPTTDDTKKSVDRSRSTVDLVRLRDKAILEMLFSTGVRVSELVSVKRDEVDPKRDECTVRGKGRKLRVVFLSEQSRYWLKKYLDARRDMSPYLFVSHDRAAKAREGRPSPATAPSPRLPAPEAAGNGGQASRERGGVRDSLTALTPRSVQRILERYARLAGIMKPVTPHTLRHSYATDLLRGGADIRSVQALLGHASITTTQIYTHVTDAGLKEVHQQYHRRTKS